MAKKTEPDLVDEQTDEEAFKGEGATTSHYVPKTARDKCQNRECGQLFSRPHHLRRPHHCRRCGEIFCRPCLQYTRRLNAMAQPDPDGVPCKVCLTCFEDRVLYLGCTQRSQTDLFRLLRKQCKDEMTDIVYEYEITTRNASEQPRFWKDQFKIDTTQECLRLLRGFKTTMSGYDTLNTVKEIKGKMNVPTWQKSMFWALESQTTRCRQCDSKLGRIKKMRNCRVCGLTLCRICSQKDLLLYFEDGQTDNIPHLAIIRYEGCPEKEPKVSVLLRCCDDCKKEIVRRQIADNKWYLQKPKPPDLQSEMIRMDDRFRQLINDIKEEIEKLQSIINEPVEDNEDVFGDDSIDGVVEFESNMTVLQIKQSEIDNIKENVNKSLQTFFNMYTELKNILKTTRKTLSQKQLVFVMNYFIAKKDFYIEVKEKLGKLTLVNSMCDDHMS
ncbi:uncharacterized protein LOC132727368 isoform X2 [Ruditapes philippinarum]|nr:uncharacterized protein LOC132727368 isoform X2 [Ruditapes philippinarum]